MDEEKRDETLKALQQEIDDEEFLPSSNYHSWVRGDCALSSNNELDSFYPTNRCRFFDKHGFIFLPGFANTDEVQSMKSAMEDLVNNEWKPSSQHPTEVFRTDQKQIEAQGRSDYFLDSASKCHFFAEKDAIKENGELKEEYNQRNNKLAALNKAGHGMHTTPGPFQSYTQSPKIATLLRELGWIDPTVPQSMYIFKQALIGGEVTSHQDSSFLNTTPRQTCIGLWLALDDATVNNGCLWIRPGSHRESVRRQFVRNPKHFGESLNYDGEDGDGTQPQMIFRQLGDEKEHNVVTWEGALPKDSLPMPECVGLHEAGFIPVPCKAGDLLAFTGELDHLSLPNFSTEPRHTFQLHCIEGENKAGVKWSKENWLQYPPGVSFM
eukprot:CAMPEP_0202027164 /NCGR_PEP_ID=MMETSP0905-20130828/60775_1 /ASSEMBLY_ACC=CAM_ASM_000554 /TAXON_ID=420261 /ORGANISM="Thalassiosira antarctica, Strain CCMP982" /LENGTH=379 /DNA_ID=CAMNT_0048590573 /DNA_START=48 /DNA_END=1184 /DNA_ORIENTATION=-